MPSRIETDQPGIAGVLEGANGPARRQEAQHRHHAQAEPRERRMDREDGPVRRDRVLEEHVEHRLIPGDVRSFGSGGPDTCASAAWYDPKERSEGRDTCAPVTIGVPTRAPFEQLEAAGNPEHRRVVQQRLRRREIEKAGPAHRELHVAHRFERRAHEHPAGAALRA